MTNYDTKTTDEASIDIDQLLAKRRQVAIVWSIENVRAVRPDLDDDQAWEVLKDCRDKHHREWGITYTLIEEITDNLYPRPRTAG